MLYNLPILIAVTLVIVIVIFLILNSYYNNNNGNIGNNKSKIKIIIVTLENRKTDYLDVHNRNVTKYCKKWDYDYTYKEKYESELPVYWHKLLYINGYLNNNLGKYDYILWLDSDTLIIDSSISLESLIEEDKHIYIGKDFPFILSDKFNSGIFMLKNSTISKNFIEDCLNNYLNNPSCKDEDGKLTLKGPWAGMCYEQGVMNHFIKEKYMEYTSVMMPKIFNNTPHKNTNCFILHHYNKDKDSISKFFTSYYMTLLLMLK